MFAYFFLQVLVFVHGKKWDLINTPMGYWYLVEMIGFVLIAHDSVLLQLQADSNIFLIKTAAVINNDRDNH